MSSEGTPLWRWLVVGLLFSSMAAYLLVTGEMALDKQRTVHITRAANPLIYWLSVLIFGVLGGLSLRKAWRQLKS